MKNCAVLKNTLFAIKKNLFAIKEALILKKSLLHCQYCNIKNCAVFKNCCYWKIKFSLLKKMLRYKKSLFAIAKNA